MGKFKLTIFFGWSVWAILLLTRLAAQPQPAVHRPKSAGSPAYTRIKRLLNAAITHNDTRTAAYCYQQIGDIFFQQGVMPQALEYYLKAAHQFSESGDPAHIADNLNKIGRVYFKNFRDAAASTHFRRAAQLSGKIRHYIGIAEANKYIAQIFERKQQTDSAHHYLELAMQAYQQLHDDNQMAFTYAKIGGIYEDEGRYQQALSYFFRGLTLYEKNGNQDKAGLLNNIGDTYRKTANYTKALQYTRLAQALAVQLKDQQQISSADRDLAKVYEKMGRYDSAYYYSEKARAAYARSFNSESDKKLNLLQALFEVQKKNAEIERLENSQQINRILAISIFLVALLIGFLSFSIISKQRLKNKNEKMIYQGRNETMKLELLNRNLREESLKDKLELQSKELSSHTLLIIQKNQFIDDLKQKVAQLIRDDKRDQRKELKQLIGLINENSDQDKNWEDFRVIYENIHENFFDRLNKRSASLTPTDLRFLALVKMNMNPADTATMLGVSQSSLRTIRYRIKKKLQLSENESLSAFVQNI